MSEATTPITTRLPNRAIIRQPDGKFLKGTKAGPGNPEGKKIAAFRKALFSAVSAKAFKALVRNTLKRANKGDSTATKLIWSYLVGRPQEMAAPQAPATTSADDQHAVRLRMLAIIAKDPVLLNAWATIAEAESRLVASATITHAGGSNEHEPVKP